MLVASLGIKFVFGFSFQKSKQSVCSLSVSSERFDLLAAHRGTSIKLIPQIFATGQFARNARDGVSSFVKKYALKQAEAHVVLCFDSYQLIQIERPPVDSKELLRTLRWEVADYIDYPAELALIDYFNVPQSVVNDKEWLYVVTAKRDEITRLIEQVEVCDFRLQSITIPELAVLSLLRVAIAEEESRENILFLWPDEKVYRLIFVNKGHLAQVRSIEKNKPNENMSDLVDNVLVAARKYLYDYPGKISLIVTSATPAALFNEALREMSEDAQCEELDIQHWVAPLASEQIELAKMPFPVVGGLCEAR